MKKIVLIALASLMAFSAGAQKLGRVNFNELVMLMPEMDKARETMSASQKEQMDDVVGKLPLLTFLFQWVYCFLYGTVLSSIMSRYIFLQHLFGGPSRPPKDEETPDEQ